MVITEKVTNYGLIGEDVYSSKTFILHVQCYLNTVQEFIRSQHAKNVFLQFRKDDLKAEFQKFVHQSYHEQMFDLEKLHRHCTVGKFKLYAYDHIIPKFWKLVFESKM